MGFSKKTVTLFALTFALTQLVACATGGHKHDKTIALIGALENCSTHHAQGIDHDNVNFSVIDASNIDYYIIVSSTDLSSDTVL